jgi:hypothetical protein
LALSTNHSLAVFTLLSNTICISDDILSINRSTATVTSEALNANPSGAPALCGSCCSFFFYCLCSVLCIVGYHFEFFILCQCVSFSVLFVFFVLFCFHFVLCLVTNVFSVSNVCCRAYRRLTYWIDYCTPLLFP